MALQEVPDLLDQKRMVGTKELVEYTGIPYGTWNQYASKGGGPTFQKIGIHRRYHTDDVKAWLKTKRHAVTGDNLAAA